MSKTFRFNTDEKRFVKRAPRPLHNKRCIDKRFCRCFEVVVPKREVKNYWSVNGDV